MHTLKTLIKNALIIAQAEGKLPDDMKELDTSIFDKALKPMENELNAVYDSCEEMMNGTADTSDNNFEAMQVLVTKWSS